MTGSRGATEVPTPKEFDVHGVRIPAGDYSIQEYHVIELVEASQLVWTVFLYLDLEALVLVKELPIPHFLAADYLTTET